MYFFIFFTLHIFNQLVYWSSLLKSSFKGLTMVPYIGNLTSPVEQ